MKQSRLGFAFAKLPLTTKIHALTDALCRPVTLLLSPGQAGNNPVLGR